MTARIPVRCRILAVGAAACCSAGCSSAAPSGPHVCTDIFALIEVTALDSTGSPVSGLTISDTVVRTHAGFSVPQNGIPDSGRYVVFEDGLQPYINAGGDAVKVTGTRGTIGFSANYTFAFADGCHVNKVAGPDTVTVR